MPRMSAPLKLEFVTSAPDLDKLPPTHAEVAVIGRSNVGKSTLLNALAGNKNLAKVSSKPGRTQLLNVFDAGDGRTLVDLPGFGYASTASKQTRAAWQDRMERYLLERPGLVLALFLVDGEIGPTKLDVDMLTWLRRNGVPFQIVATKHDKVKASKRHARTRDLAAGCAIDPIGVLWVSAEKKTGLAELGAVVRGALAAG